MRGSNRSISLDATWSTLCPGNGLFSFLSSGFPAHCFLWNEVLDRVPTVWGKRHKSAPLVRRVAVGDGGWKEAESFCGGEQTLTLDPPQLIFGAPPLLLAPCPASLAASPH